MSTQQLHILSIPQPDLLELKRSYLDTINQVFTRVFGCWHLELSRPFTNGRECYRSCLRCGMHRNFDLQSWSLTGNFYVPTVERRFDR